MKLSKIIVLALVATAIGLFFVLDLERYLTVAAIQAQLDGLRAWYADHPVLTQGLYFGLYVLITGLSLPGALAISLLGGALFGLVTGVLLISFASTLGATLAMLLSRFILRDAVQSRFGDKLATINRGIERDGAFYLFTLRLIPVFPFFVINLLMGLTPMATARFFLVSQVGMLPGTIVFVNAGTQLGQLHSASGILSPALLGSFALLGLFPFLARALVGRINRYRAYRGFQRPRGFDYNLLVIGAGAGGLVSAYIGAAVRARVALVEKDRMGGDCLYRGCVPSKTLLRAARCAAELRRAGELGFEPVEVRADFAAIMQRVQSVIRQIEPHDSMQRYTAMGVDCIAGQARLLSPWEIDVGGRRLSARNLVIATGSRPAVPAIDGLEEGGYLTSDSVWQLREQPRRLLVIGGGAVGCELSQAFARLGSEVSIIVRGERLLRMEDEDGAALVGDGLARDGVSLYTGYRPLRCERRDGERYLVCGTHGGERSFAYDALLIATGRRPVTDGLGVEELGLAARADGSLEANEYLQTRFPNVYTVGDVTGPLRYTHVAAHQAWYAVVNALFGRFRRFAVNYAAIPRVIYTDPELAVVGLTENQARQQGIAFELTRYGLDDLDRAIIDADARGYVKVLTEPGRDRVLGAAVCGTHAGELITEFVTAMRHGLPLGRILSTVHAYPTLSEAAKYQAGTWKLAHAPGRLLHWAERYHRWARR